MSQTRLFGTDGIRGHAGSAPLDPATLRRCGLAIATLLEAAGKRPRVLVGRDTRESGVAIEADLTRGLTTLGLSVTSGGILSTPAVAFLTMDGGFDAGIVISASHNPYSDNGIKLFSSTGFKFPDSFEGQIETLVAEELSVPPNGPETPIHVYPRGTDPLLKTRYVNHLASVLPRDFSFEGCRIVLDCANGAAVTLAPDVFRRLGADVHVIAAEPDGRNINHDCGALHPERLADEVRKRGALLGAAFDGDADRCILVDETGQIRDGDDMLAIAGRVMHEEGTLGDTAIVSTVMANYGLEAYLGSLGIGLLRTAVGDRHVMAEMLRRKVRLGGEQSGHMIFLEHATTGDGILSALRLAHLTRVSGKPLSELASCWARLPQVLHNVRVRERVDLRTIPAIATRLDEVERKMHERGRLLVRYSGTEPLARIMLEGEDRQEIEAHARYLADAIQGALG